MKNAHQLRKPRPRPSQVAVTRQKGASILDALLVVAVIGVLTVATCGQYRDTIEKVPRPQKVEAALAIDGDTLPEEAPGRGADIDPADKPGA